MPKKKRYPVQAVVSLPEGVPERMEAVAHGLDLQRGEWMRSRLLAALADDEKRIARRAVVNPNRNGDAR